MKWNFSFTSHTCTGKCKVYRQYFWINLELNTVKQNAVSYNSKLTSALMLLFILQGCCYAKWNVFQLEETIFTESCSVSIMVYLPLLRSIINSIVSVWWILYTRRLLSSWGKFYIYIYTLNNYSFSFKDGRPDCKIPVQEYTWDCQNSIFVV